MSSIGKWIVMCGCAFAVVFGASLEESDPKTRECEIEPFERELFNKSFVLDNKLICDDDEGTGKLNARGLCFHLYKCPLDFTETERHSPCICKRGGTWDFDFPTCSDMIPLAIAMLHDIMTRPHDPTSVVLDESETKGTNFQVKLKSGGFFVKPPTTTTAPPKNTTRSAPSFPRSNMARMCRNVSVCEKAAKAPQKCEIYGPASSRNLPYLFCKICLMEDLCREAIVIW